MLADGRFTNAVLSNIKVGELKEGLVQRRISFCFIFLLFSFSFIFVSVLSPLPFTPIPVPLSFSFYFRFPFGLFPIYLPFVYFTFGFIYPFLSLSSFSDLTSTLITVDGGASLGFNGSRVGKEECVIMNYRLQYGTLNKPIKTNKPQQNSRRAIQS